MVQRLFLNTNTEFWMQMCDVDQEAAGSHCARFVAIVKSEFGEGSFVLIDVPSLQWRMNVNEQPWSKSETSSRAGTLEKMLRFASSKKPIDQFVL